MQDLYEGVDQEAGAEPGHLGDVVEEPEHLRLDGRLVGESSQHVQEQLHALLVQKHCGKNILQHVLNFGRTFFSSVRNEPL